MICVYVKVSSDAVILAGVLPLKEVIFQIYIHGRTLGDDTQSLEP